MDILGYMEMIRAAEEADAQQELLQRLHGALSEGRRWLESEDDALAELKRIIPEDNYALKAFTDNIIAWPIRDDAEVEFGLAFSALAQFQFTMTLRGFLSEAPCQLGRPMSTTSPSLAMP